MSALKKEALNSVLTTDVWGTIGPKSVKSAAMIAKRVSVQHGLLLHSASAALEAQLRSLHIAYGDEVILASYGDPMNSMTVAMTGATPVFVDICLETATIWPEDVKEAVTSKTKAVIADAPGGNPFDAKALAEICKEKNIALIINLGDGFDTAQDGKPLTKYALASVMDFADGCAVPAGLAGALAIDDKKIYSMAYAFHNCGRTPDVEDVNSLVMEDLIGGDMRIAEWQSALIEVGMGELDVVLKNRKAKAEALLKDIPCKCLTPIKIIDGGVSSYSYVIYKHNKDECGGETIEVAVKELQEKGFNACRPWVAMHRQSVFASDYFKKATGYTKGYTNDGVEESIQAEESLIWIKV
jgi:dTDP-4-amino-4,6-dideoxygalactose transaminase